MPASPLTSLRDGDLDAVVLGGGLTGAATARALAARGARVVLVEPVDFGWGGSGRTARLAFAALPRTRRAAALQRTALHERLVLARAARHLARVVPVLDLRERAGGHGLLGWLRARVRGRLLHVPGWPAPREVGPRQLSALLPGLALAVPEAATVHFDALLDDRRLALALALDARSAGASLASRCDVVGIEAAQPARAWVELRDRLTGESVTLRTRAVVNATGAWLDRTRRLYDLHPSELFPLTRAARLVVSQPPIEAGLVLPHPRDGRTIALAPSAGGPLASAEDGASEAADDGYLDEAVAAAFDLAAGAPRARFVAARAARDRPGVVRETHAGVPFWSVTSGGALFARTTARGLAERLVAHIGAPQGRAARLPGFLPGGDIASLAGEEAAARAAGLSPAAARWLIARYGSLWRDVAAEEGGTEPVGAGDVPLACELAWAVRVEGARTLADVLHRFRAPEVARSAADEDALAAGALARLARLAGFGAARIERERTRWDRERELVYGAAPAGADAFG